MMDYFTRPSEVLSDIKFLFQYSKNFYTKKNSYPFMIAI